MWWVIAEAGRRFRSSQWWPALVTGLLRNATLLPAASFEVILSQAAVHNLPDASDRKEAIEEMARVLRAAGKVPVADIRHLDEYAAVLEGAWPSR
jgi:ubiquinone/menaquinone biosynthesis C-methylase UbiE